MALWTNSTSCISREKSITTSAALSATTFTWHVCGAAKSWNSKVIFLIGSKAKSSAIAASTLSFPDSRLEDIAPVAGPHPRTTSYLRLAPTTLISLAHDHHIIIDRLRDGDPRTLARVITAVENRTRGSAE